MMSGMTTLRRDVARNRERILDAGRALRASGEPVQLNAVARMAEVGVGTVYRHFATPEALVEGLVEHRFVELTGLARDSLDEADALGALRAFLQRALAVYAEDPEFAAASGAATSAREQTLALRADLVDAFGALVDRAAVRLRPGLDAADLMILCCGLGHSVRFRPQRTTAYLDAMLAAALV